jgi:hypothetical protein
MSDVTVTIPADEAMFVLAALDRHISEAYRTARKMRNLGQSGAMLDIAETTAARSERARRRIADALYPLDAIRREDVAEEVEFGLA